MKVHDSLYQLCGVVDKKEFAWVPFTEHKLVDYKIELPNYILYVDVNGKIIEFIHPVHENLEHLRNNINKYLGKTREKTHKARIVG